MKRIIRLFALVALIGSGTLTMAQSVKIPAIVSNKQVSEPAYEVKYADGIVIKVVGANNATTRKPLYLAAYAAAHPVAPPPVIPPGIKWDIYTPENLAKMVGLKDTYVKIKISDKPYTGQYAIENFKNVTIDLGATEGNVFSTWNMETWIMKGINNGVHFINGKVSNTNRSFIRYDYLGAEFLNDITIDKMVLDNTGALFDSQGGYKDSPEQLPLGVINNFKITNTVIKNSPGQGTFVVVKGDNFLIDNLTVDNVAITSGQHAHILVLMGRGTLSNSKLTNHRGSFNRLTPYNIYGDTTKKSYIVNNIVENSTRYGAFEVYYTPEETMKTPNWHTSAVYISNNTVGNLGWTDKTWENTLVDVYDSRGWVVAYNNLCYNMYSTNNFSNPSLINYASRNGNDPTVRQFNNIYKSSWSELLIDRTNYKSKFTGIGASQ